MKNKKNKDFIHQNQKSFFFEDFLESSQIQRKINKSKISDDRLYFLFSIFFSLILIFSISIFFISIKPSSFYAYKDINQSHLKLRRDIVDRNGDLIARNINSYHAAIKPNLIKNKDNFIIKIKLNFPEISSSELKKNLDKKKYFYFKKRLTDEEKNKLWSLGEKGIIIEPFQSRVYPHGQLFSHVLGQIDDDNYGISGVEKYFDKDLRNNKLSNPLFLTVDTNVQFLIKKSDE